MTASNQQGVSSILHAWLAGMQEHPWLWAFGTSSGFVLGLIFGVLL